MDFRSVNRSNGTLVVFVALLMSLVIGFGIFVICFALPRETDTVGTTTRTIVIDPGHGGMDAGTVGVVTGNKESDLNLMIAQALAADLKASGFNVVLTRTTKDGLYGDTSPGFKRRDMQARAAVIQSCSPTITVSIHMNKYASPTRRGAQVYFQKGDDASMALANVLQSALNDELNAAGGRTFEALSGDYYICKVSPCPAVIVECGFLSNPEDDRLMATAAYRERLAATIKNGISEYLALMTVAP